MTELLVIKTGALGDVLRTTSILPGLAAALPDLRVTWVTAPAARDLVAHHPLVQDVVTVAPKDADAIAALGASLAARRWDRVLSFDDEEPLCALAASLTTERLSGATLDEHGTRIYTDDVAPWFDMGLLSRHGKTAADRLKIENTRTHPAIFAAMLGIDMGRPELPLPADANAFGAAFAATHGLGDRGGDRPLVIGLNTGAGGRWKTKELPIDRVVALVDALRAQHGDETAFVLLGGPDEAERNATIRRELAALATPPRVVDGGTDNALTEFAAIVAQLDLLITSDSLALHIGVSQRARIVAFFAPTSAAEIELYGLGEKVWSTAPDYCSYRPDADNATITVERLLAAIDATLARA